MSFEELIICVFDECYQNDKLTKQEIESCRNLCQIYENKLYENELNSKLLCNIDLEDSKIENKNKKNIKISNYEYYFNKDEINLIKDTTQKFDLYFENYKLQILFETTNEFINSGKTKLTNIKIYIDNNLILKKEHQNLKKEFINLSYFKNILSKFKELDIETTEKKFLIMLIKTMNIEHYFIDIIKNINENEIEKYCHILDMESDSDSSLSINSGENDELLENEE